MDKLTYLKRIGVYDIAPPTLDYLKTLQAQHLLHVPFENLNIHYGIPIVLDKFALFRKVVTLKRGGYCYELNTLFAELLTALGFQVSLVSVQVHQSGDHFGPAYDHMALLVHLGDTACSVENINTQHSSEGKMYLVDVGFGAFSQYPLAIDDVCVQHDPYGQFLVTKQGASYLVSHVKTDETTPIYLLNPKPSELSEFTEMNQYHQSSPESFFTQQAMISRPTPEGGRITLTERMLRIRDGSGKVEETPLPDQEAFMQYLTRYFYPATLLTKYSDNLCNGQNGDQHDLLY